MENLFESLELGQKLLVILALGVLEKNAKNEKEKDYIESIYKQIMPNANDSITVDIGIISNALLNQVKYQIREEIKLEEALNKQNV